MGRGEQRRRGASAPARWFRCGCATGRRRPYAHGGKETRSEARALREYTSHTNAKMGNMHASNEIKCARRRLRQSYDARGQKCSKRVSGSKR
eukprot:737359-Pleurochrysis_carterae.AAC.1